MANAFGGTIQPAAPIIPAARQAESRLAKMRIRSLKEQIRQKKLDNRVNKLSMELNRQETRRLRA